MKTTLYKVIKYVAFPFLSRIQKIKLIPPKILCGFENIFATALRKKVRFSYDKNINYFMAEEGRVKLFFKNFERGTWLYRNGIEKRADFIFKSYCLQNVTFYSGDVVIDCGANSGDLTLKLFKDFPGIKYFGIEPSPEDYEVLSKNVTEEGAELVNKALGDKDETLKFYICSEKGDSSLIEPPSYTDIIEVTVIKLETFVKNLGLKRIKLIKIEAEGFEPEILNGALGILDRVEYIAVDGGYERGVDSEQTLTLATNFLLANGFEMIDIYFPWCRALYRNKIIK